MQILKWLGILLDTHFSQLILTPSCHAIISKLKDTVLEEIQFCRHATWLAGELRHFATAPAGDLKGAPNDSSNYYLGGNASNTPKKRKFSSTSSLEEFPNIGQYRLEIIPLFKIK